ncbi:MAG: isochorismatase family protein [Mycobacterium sp.]|uniref:isochorismatase family protein n=1 Tax=Mycobacterium sp. TaxID=1785 RepID=UPI003BAE6536
MAADLRELVRPAKTVLLTQECQRGVVGPDSMIPALAEAARTSGALANVTRLVHAARAANVGVLHALAARRRDGRGANTNARLFVSVAREPNQQWLDSDAALPLEEFGPDDSDLTSTRLHGLSPIFGQDVDGLLRNLGCRTLIIVGVSTNVAIPNAVFDAVNLGYQVVLPVDAVAGVPVGYSDTIIRNSLSLVATTTSTDEVLACWC